MGSGDGRTTMGEEGALGLQAEAASPVLLIPTPTSEGSLGAGVRAPPGSPEPCTVLGGCMRPKFRSAQDRVLGRAGGWEDQG